jgi:hypothetical protein
VAENARELLKILDEIGVEWRQVRCDLQIRYDPREWQGGYACSLIIEVPTAYLDAKQVREAAARLEGAGRRSGA